MIHFRIPSIPTHPPHACVHAATQIGRGVEYRGHNQEEICCPDSLCSPNNQTQPLPLTHLDSKAQTQGIIRCGLNGKSREQRVQTSSGKHSRQLLRFFTKEQSLNREIFEGICGRNHNYPLSPPPSFFSSSQLVWSSPDQQADWNPCQHVPTIHRKGVRCSGGTETPRTTEDRTFCP